MAARVQVGSVVGFSLPALPLQWCALCFPSRAKRGIGVGESSLGSARRLHCTATNRAKSGTSNISARELCVLKFLFATGEVLHNAPATQFSFSDQYLLATFCQITMLVREQADRARKARPENRVRELKVLFEAIKSQSLIATKLRLTTSARTRPHVISRAHDAHKPSAYALLRAEADAVEPA